MRPIRLSEVLIRGAFKLLPTIAIIFYLWSLSAFSTSQFQTSLYANLAVLAIGITLSYLLYSYRIRFSISFAILLLLVYVLYRMAGSGVGGEFDSFYMVMAFSVYAVVFVFAWLIGYGFARHDLFTWVLAFGIFIYASGLLVTDFISLRALVGSEIIRIIAGPHLAQNPVLYQIFAVLLALFLPVLFYCIYLIFVNDVLRRVSPANRETTWLLLRKSLSLTGALGIILLMLIMMVRFFGLPDWVQQQVNQAQGNSTSFLKKTYNEQTQQPEFDLNDYAQLLPEIELSDETVFCTYIDNFLPTEDGQTIPLPLHFRRFVLNRFEPGNEKFVLDPYPPSAIPNDLFSPATRDVPIGFSVDDPVIRKSTAVYSNRKDVASTVYVQALTPDAYLAPNTGYSYQKLPVPPEDKETFHTVYQCSSLISIWNLPPFVYSSTQPDLVEYRDMRAAELRRNRSYSGLDSTFMRYYTQMDTTDSLIMQLSANLVGDRKNPYDKVNAIVEYMTGKEEDGSPRFTYTLKPGSPENTDQSLMHYFLFDNKKGYCTYFAGATTLLLRAAGIPCRVVVGYAIFDRSNKNSGWYWVYADQGHAWLEVYFPEHGWIDFDTTPSADTEPSRPPKPDATPPEYAREPFLAVLGELTGITGDSTALLVRPFTLRHRSKEYKIAEEDAGIITLKPGDGMVTIDNEKQKIGSFEIRDNMIVSAYSFDYSLEKIRRYNHRGTVMEWFAGTFPKTIPVDEAIVIYKDKTEPGGIILTVTGQLDSVLADSGRIAVVPTTITWRGKDFPVDPRKATAIVLQPEEQVIYRDGKKIALTDFVAGDSMMVAASSAAAELHGIKPYLATEPFLTWFGNRFPKVIPVERVTLQLQEIPLIHRIGWGLLYVLLAIAAVLLLLATLLYLYLSVRSRTASGSQKLYWIYRLSLMLLNQLGFARSQKTPQEYADAVVDPALNTGFRQFIDLYQKAKYAPGQPAATELDRAEQFRQQFVRQVFAAFSRKDILRSFLNFRRTLQFLFVRM